MPSNPSQLTKFVVDLARGAQEEIIPEDKINAIALERLERLRGEVKSKDTYIRTAF